MDKQVVREIQIKSLKENKKIYHGKWYQKNREKNRERSLKQSREYQKKNPEKIRETREKSHKKLVNDVLNIISNDDLCCVSCGCDDLRLLEINHKNGGGRKDMRNHNKFYRDIRNGKRKIDDLEILCKVCNSHHYLELKFGKLPYIILYYKNEEIINE